MMKAVLMFPGQGSQYAGMCRDFYEADERVRKLFSLAKSISGKDMERLCFEEPSELSLTENTQPAMVLCELAMCELVKEKLSELDIEVSASCGLSLGEYAAIAEAGALSFEDTIKAVTVRGRLMAEAVPNGVGAMAAILNPDLEKLKSVIDSVDGAYIANFNSPAQIVITGYKEAVEEAMEKLSLEGMKRSVMLNVSGPFHSPLLSKASEQLRSTLSELSFKQLNHPYYANVDARPVTDALSIKDSLVRQVCSSVCWQQTIENLLSAGERLFIEVGPGKTLSGFVQKTAKAYAKSTGTDLSELKIINIDKLSDLEKLKENHE